MKVGRVVGSHEASSFLNVLPFIFLGIWFFEKIINIVVIS
jgi:hypothetical protein